MSQKLRRLKGICLWDGWLGRFRAKNRSFQADLSPMASILPGFPGIG